MFWLFRLISICNSPILGSYLIQIFSNEQNKNVNFDIDILVYLKKNCYDIESYYLSRCPHFETCNIVFSAPGFTQFHCVEGMFHKCNVFLLCKIIKVAHNYRV